MLLPADQEIPGCCAWSREVVVELFGANTQEAAAACVRAAAISASGCVHVQSLQSSHRSCLCVFVV